MRRYEKIRHLDDLVLAVGMYVVLYCIIWTIRFVNMVQNMYQTDAFWD